jgi:DNA repair protein RadC
MRRPDQLKLPFEARPRTRIALAGIERLSEVELIALVAGKGRSEGEALILGQRVLSAFGSLRDLRGAGVHELSRVEGIGPAGASALVAACELGRRATRPSGPRTLISCAADVAAVCGEEMAAYDREHFRVMVLDTKNRLIACEDVSIGSLSASLVHPRELYKSAIRRSAAGVVVVHNHPSGDVTPSLADIELTKRLVKAGDVLGIDLLDHVIVGDGRWTSLKELNYL